MILSARKRAEIHRRATPPQLFELFKISLSYTEDASAALSALTSSKPSQDGRKERGALFPLYFDSGSRYLDFMESIMRSVEPEVVVETGVANGVSTRRILDVFNSLQKKQPALHPRLHSIDVDERTRWDDLVADSRWTFHLSSGKAEIEEILRGIGPFDLFIHDSDHRYRNQMREYRAAWQLLKPGGVLLSDDVNWSHAFLDFCNDLNLKPVILSEAPKVAGAVRKPPA